MLIFHDAGSTKLDTALPHTLWIGGISVQGTVDRDLALKDPVGLAHARESDRARFLCLLIL